ncbi:hypothetical protein MVEN_02549700 [Mycena venus]|uniref:Uncharacterized protein n=1 Tax=Mycena venus TaxID=2733690 RepID=A0A8H6U3W6_9AGAR|nr:hypothetical protein MVEN_02549700 [Mycena venus]
MPPISRMRLPELIWGGFNVDDVSIFDAHPSALGLAQPQPAQRPAANALQFSCPQCLPSRSSTSCASASRITSLFLTSNNQTNSELPNLEQLMLGKYEQNFLESVILGVTAICAWPDLDQGHEGACAYV